MNELTDQQQNAVEYVRQGKNLFFTGAGGTGKSYTLKYIINMLPQSTTFITALTGIAAVNIGGQTIHKFSGINLGNGDVDTLMSRLTSRGRINWAMCKILVIDEISMMSGQLFDKLEAIARRVKNCELPFGGIQILLTGDFYQCPPINKKFHENDEDVKQCFEAESWERCVDISYELVTIERQKESLGRDLVTALRESEVDKFGSVQLDERMVELLRYLARPLKPRRDGILPTKLFCTNRDVDRENLIELAKLPGSEHVYIAIDVGQSICCMAKSTLHLKVGAQVMLIKNHQNNRLCNGSRGIVVRFEMSNSELLPVVKFKNGDEEIINFETWNMEDRNGKSLASRKQVALTLASALSVHKSQGQTIDYLEINIANAFDYGIAYVALTRFVSLTGLRVVGYDVKKIRNNPKVVAFTKQMREKLQQIAE